MFNPSPNPPSDSTPGSTSASENSASPPRWETTERRRRRYRVRWFVGLIVLILLAVPATIHSAAAIATMRNVPDTWLPSTLPLKQQFMDFYERFGLIDVMFISWSGAELGDADVREVTMLLRELSEENDDDTLDRFDQTAVPESARSFWKQAMEICDGERPFQWVRSGTEIRDSLTGMPLNAPEASADRRLHGTFVGPDGKRTCVCVCFTAASGSHQRILLPLIRQAIADLIHRPRDGIVFVGGPVDGAAVDGEAINSIQKYTVPSSIIAALLCWICLRSIPLTFTILGIATVGQGMVLAAVYYMGTPMNAILIVLPPLVFVLTVSAGIHLSNYYFDFVRTPGVSVVAAAERAMKIGVPPCLAATTTTVVGLLSLSIVRLEPVRLFGVIGSVGVLLTLGLLILMLPGAMLFARRGVVVPETASTKFNRGRPVRWLRPISILLVFGLLSCFAVMGLGRLTTSVSVPDMFLPESELRQQYDWYEEHVGATMTAEILLSFATPENGDPSAGDEIAQLRKLLKVQAAVNGLPEVGGILSAANFLPVPTHRSSIAATISRAAIESQIANRESDIYTLGYVDQSKGERTWRLSLRLYQTGNHDFSSTMNEIVKTAKTTLLESAQGPTGRVTMTGHLVIVEGTQKLLLKDLFTSFLTAFGVIAVFVAIYLRSVIGGVLAMIPNLIPTLFLFGTMGWLRWPLDIGSVMTASVALGIAVDDSVHLLAQYRLARQTAPDGRSAALTALQHCGWAMLQTTVVCSFSLMVYGLSEFVPTRRFAFFMMGLLSLAWIGVSTLLPAIMATRGGDFLAGRAIRSSTEPKVQ
ncbi:efflux RND transporter permease subunit [Allorhodopirellula solitaria]|uniref:MMPL family protein n=1 Tax=Allorhodopirellula solitaria TaxID=2527987 RepID=A0A5C5XTL3_9BACT|nr:MMPL family transporter [Allorhodopirellula solitaria]TWT65365.1 MMPL family protein [Allorhodopirellula solitaria]